MGLVSLGLGADGCYENLSLEPPALTGGSLESWYRSTENVQLGAALFTTAGAGPTMTLSGSVIQSLGIKVQITPDATHYRYSIDNGTNWLESNLPTSATPHAIGATGITLTLPVGSYTNGTVEEAICSNWKDKTAHGYDLTNATTGTRPRVIVNGQHGLPLLRNNGTNMRLIGPAALAQQLFSSVATGGVNTPFYIVGAFYLTAIPTGVNIMTIVSGGSSTSPDVPVVALQISSTRIRVRRRLNAGTDLIVNASAALPPQIGFYVFEFEFDGVNARVSFNTADIIGGDSGTPAPFSFPGAMALDEVAVAALASSTLGSFGNIDMYELACFSGAPPPKAEKLGLVNYMMQRYGLGDRTAPAVNICLFDWDGVHTKNPDPTTWGIKTTLFNPAALDSIKERFAYRKPTRLDGTEYWYMQGSGDPGTEQANMDDQQQTLLQTSAYYKRVSRIFNWYPKASDISSGAVPLVTAIRNAGIDRYDASSGKSNTPFALVISSGTARYDVNGSTTGTWLNFPAFLADYVSMMQAPQYLKIRGLRPVVVLFDTPGAPWDLTHKNQITTAALAGGLPTPIYINCNESTGAVLSLGLDGQTSYGPSGGAPSGASNQHLAYSTQITADQLNWPKSATGTGNKAFPPITIGNDARPQRGEPPTSWYVDEPVYSEFEQHLRNWHAFIRMNYTLCLDLTGFAYAFNENGECGPTLPTTQSRNIGPLGTNLGYKFEALFALITGNFPSVYKNYYTSNTLNSAIARTAGWAFVQDLWDNAGEGAAWQYSVMRSSTVGDVFTCAPATPVQQFEWWGTKGPTLGMVEIRVDAILVATIDCSQPSLARHQLLFTSALLAPGTHTSTATVASGTIEIDLVVTENNRA